jgi:hypothetical protein
MSYRLRRSKIQEGKNWILPKETNANQFFWLEIWKDHVYPSMEPNGGRWLWTPVTESQNECNPPRGIILYQSVCPFVQQSWNRNHSSEDEACLLVFDKKHKDFVRRGKEDESTYVTGK